jgi:transglutaminase-like putative cysteine protease
VQSVPTLLENNQNGVVGGGDCDDLTVLTLAACYANGLKPNYIFLVGRSKAAPVHIYSGVKFEGKIFTLDLTNQFINMEREYKFCQILEI